MSYIAAGTAAAGVASAYLGKDAGKDAAKAQMKYYARYVLPKIQEEQRFNQGLNVQGLGQYTSSGNQAMNMLTGLGTGQFGLTDVDQQRLAELQGMDLSSETDSSRGYLRNQANRQELNALLEKQQMGGELGGGGLGEFLQGHPLYEAMQNVGGNALNEQYAAAFGGQAPSSFMGEQRGRMGSENLLNTYSAIQNPLIQVAGLGGQALGQQVGANTNLAQTTMNSLGQFGGQAAMTAGQNPGMAGVMDAVGSGIGIMGERLDPLNQAANKYLMDWFAKKSGGIGGNTGSGGVQGYNSPGAWGSLGRAGAGGYR